MVEKNSDRNKTSKKATWFGFTLNQKQMLFIFILALIGVIFTPMILINGIFMLISYIPYIYRYDGTFYFQMFVFNLSVIITMCVVLIICIYTIIRTRIIRDINS